MFTALSITFAIATPVLAVGVTSTGRRKLFPASTPKTPAVVISRPSAARRSNVATPFVGALAHMTVSGPELVTLNRREPKLVVILNTGLILSILSSLKEPFWL